MNPSYTLLAIVSGLCLSVQGPINTALAKRTDKFQATMISFLGGVILLCIIVPTAGTGDLSRIREVEFWQLLGGAYGVLGVCSSIIAIPALGVALTVTSMMLGQLLTGAVIDQYGIFCSIPTAVTPLRIVGIIIVAAGIIAIYLGSRNKDADNSGTDKDRPWLLLLSFSAGVAGAIQSPTNASLAGIVGGWESTLISFTIGFAIITIITLMVNHGKLKPLIGKKVKSWMLVGGPFGVAVVFINLYTVHFLGTALQVACGMSGQLLGGIVVDSFGLIQSTKVKINPLRIVGVLIILAGVAIITVSKMQQ